MNYRYIIIFLSFFSPNLKITNIQFLTKDFLNASKSNPITFIFSQNMHGLDRLVEIILCFLILYENSNDKNYIVICRFLLFSVPTFNKYFVLNSSKKRLNILNNYLITLTLHKQNNSQMTRCFISYI